jgi:hypothetical protein
MTRVVHCKKEKYDVYIGRPSIFGNPFSIGKDGNRKEVIAKFGVYFFKRIMTDENFYHSVSELKGKILGCWCKPEDCHGDIIATYLEIK